MRKLYIQKGSLLFPLFSTTIVANMPYPIDEKLVIAVSSSALFDMQASDAIFRQEGEDAYRKYQQRNEGARRRKEFPYRSAAKDGRPDTYLRGCFHG